MDKIETYDDLLNLLKNLEDAMRGIYAETIKNEQKAETTYEGYLSAKPPFFKNRAEEYASWVKAIRNIRDLLLEHKPNKTAPALRSVARTFEDLET